MHDFVLDTQDDFTRNDAYVDTNTVDVLVTVDGDVELGYGDFYNMIDTEGSFKEGTHTRSVTITREGSLKLNLPSK
ncbi:hypothetical protein QO179_24630 [Bacillus stercoris]|nr:hypothetical protein [Bacillus stercoris]